MRKTAGFFLISAFIFTAPLRAEVKLPAVIGDHMVLQQNSKVILWGWADPGEKIEVKGTRKGMGGKTRANENGTWQVKIKTPKAGGEAVTLTIKGNNEIILRDVLIGEVWVCSGQSNMEWTMNKLGTDIGAADMAAADVPQIRLLTVQQTASNTPQADCTGVWQVCSAQSVQAFSAVGYYYGKELHDALNIPVGLISTNWGGTPAEAWTSVDGLKEFETFKQTLETMKNPEQGRAVFQQQMRDWEKQIDQMDPGCQQGWYQPDADETDWKEMELPKEWTGTELGDLDGIVWFRRETSLPPSWAKIDLELHLGPIDDIDTLWFNGIKIGTTTGWDRPRVYRIPASVLHVGKNTITVRVVDTGGGGGLYGNADDMRLGPVGADVKTSATVARTWKYKISRPDADIPFAPIDITGSSPNRPTVLYNGMIAPLIPFRIAGAIWYQGEANCYDPIMYRTLFPAMIGDWRTQWDQGDFPFYYVQIAPYQYDAATCSQAVREAQMMTLEAIDNVGMAVTMDIGTKTDIHPRNKHDVGDRLARWALAKTYGQKDVVYSGPVYKKMRTEGDKIRISFDYADGGLVAVEGGLTDFEIAGADQKFVPAVAVIDGDTVVVSAEAVKDPAAVRYGWSNWVQGSLFNKASLPASSFRTDDWPLR